MSLTESLLYVSNYYRPSENTVTHTDESASSNNPLFDFLNERGLFPSSTNSSWNSSNDAAQNNQQTSSLMDDTSEDDLSFILRGYLKPSKPTTYAVIVEDDDYSLESLTRSSAHKNPGVDTRVNPEMATRVKKGAILLLFSVLTISISLLVLHLLKINIKQASASSSGIEFFALTGLVGFAGLCELIYARSRLYK